MYFFFSHSTSLTPAAKLKLRKQENVTNKSSYGEPWRTEALLEVQRRARELPDVRVSSDGSSTGVSQVLSKTGSLTGSLAMGLLFGLAPSQPRPSYNSPNE